MRLIDADAEIEKLKAEIKDNEKEIQALNTRRQLEEVSNKCAYEEMDELNRNINECKKEMRLLRTYKTAYNVDKVVEQMESCPYTQDWIEIVKEGGLSEQ